MLRNATVAGLVLSVGCLTSSPAFAGMQCEEGVWDVTAWGKSPDGQEYTSTATSTRHCLFDGALELDEYRAIGPDGSLVFIGASFHYWSVGRQNVKTLWVMGGDPGYTLLGGRVEDGRLVSTGEGVDAGGSFLERSTHTYSGERDYQFDMDRSYDGGATWIDGFSMSEATLRSSDAPALSAALQPGALQAKELAGDRSTGAPILDGYAEVEEIFETKGGDKVRVLRFSSRYKYMGPDRWRSIYWELGADAIKESEITIKASQPH